MSNTSKKRDKIESSQDMTSGAGLGAKVSNISVQNVSISQHSPILSANVAITIKYAAGYAITGSYIYSSKHPFDMSDRAKRLDYVKNGEFEFDIKYVPYVKRGAFDFSMQNETKNYDLWAVKINKGAVLDEILDFVTVHINDDNVASYELDEDAAYQMLGHLACNNVRLNIEPFTVDFVKELDVKVRKAISAFLKASCL